MHDYVIVGAGSAGAAPTNAPTIMIAEKAAEMVREGAAVASGVATSPA